MGGAKQFNAGKMDKMKRWNCFNTLKKDTRGHILLQLLIIIPIMYIVLFLPLEFTFAQYKRSVLNDVLDLALQKAAVEGGITYDVRRQILTDLEERGFNRSAVIIAPEADRSHLRGEIIELTISVPGGASSLKGVRAIGGTPPPDTWLITAAGKIMSEKLP